MRPVMRASFLSGRLWERVGAAGYSPAAHGFPYGRTAGPGRQRPIDEGSVGSADGS